MKIHPNELRLRELVERIEGDQADVFAHLLSCELCRTRALPLLRRHSSRLATRIADALEWNEEPGDYRSTFLRIGSAHEDALCAFEAEREQARGLLAELIAQPAERRVLILENNSRFRTWGLLERLIDAGRETAYADAASGEQYGRLALLLADHLDSNRYGADRIEDLRARTWAVIGNCRRIRADLRGAEMAFAQSYRHLKAGTGDLLERAIVLDLRASLVRAQRRLDQAMRLLQRAFSIFMEYGDTHRAGRALVKMDDVFHQLGTPEKGIPLLHRAIDLINPDEEPYLVLCIWHNLIDDLAGAGRYLEAHGLLTRALPIYRRFPDVVTESRRKWVQGKISRGLGQTMDAEALFLAAREGFLAAGVSYNSALVSLDLASIYAEQGRAAELQAVAEEILPFFVSQRIHREALAAVLFLRQAIVTKRVSLDLVTHVASYLKRAQHDPSLSFEQP